MVDTEDVIGLVGHSQSITKAIQTRSPAVEDYILVSFESHLLKLKILKLDENQT